MADACTLTQDLGGRWFGAHGLAPRPVCRPERRRDQAAPSIAQGRGGRLLLRCHKAGCGFADILRAAGLAPGAPSRPDPEAEARRMAELAAQRKRREGAAWRIWQEARPARGTLPIGEGIETTLAAATLYGAPRGAWAALSATGMPTLNLAHIPPAATIAALSDGDEAGLGAMRKLAARAHPAGFAAKILPAPMGRDSADMLELAARQAEKGGAA